MRVVVVGHGMAGSRVVSELAGRCELTVFGAEPHPAYNRVLLTEVLAGRQDPDAIALGQAPDGVRLKPGVHVVAIDRHGRRIVDSEGNSTGYDALVLATGSTAWMPPGLDAPGACAFRTLDDCRRIIQAAESARTAVVLGGGVLGLEAARGLALRGLEVTVVHPEPHLMQRQLDADAGRILAQRLAALGIRVRLGTPAEAADGTGLRLRDGTRLPADLVVVACGVRPETALARDAGLAVARGVVVDDGMRSVSDPRVWAVGECAEHDGTVYGLVAPAWEQARVAAAQITGTDRRYTGSRQVTRLKADGIELAAMGESLTDRHCDEPEVEVLTFTDPARATYKKIVLRRGRLTGAIMLGEIDTVGTVTQLFDAGLPVLGDRACLLFSGLGSGPDASDVVCRCNGVTGAAVRAARDAGAHDLAAIARTTRATTGCGGCRERVAALLSSSSREQGDDLRAWRAAG